MEDKFCSEHPFYWNLEWLFHISCSRDIISQCVKSACFVEFNLNVSNGTGGWYPLNIYYVVVALMLTCVTLHTAFSALVSTKTIICEIGCSFTGTSDELKPNHNVIHSILFLCAFMQTFFHSMHVHVTQKVKSFVAWIVNANITFWYARDSTCVDEWMLWKNIDLCGKEMIDIQNGHWWLKRNWSMCTIHVCIRVVYTHILFV